VFFVLNQQGISKVVPFARRADFGGFLQTKSCDECRDLFSTNKSLHSTQRFVCKITKIHARATEFDAREIGVFGLKMFHF